MKLKIGDKVRVLENINSHCYEIGSVVTVKYIGEHGHFEAVKPDGDTGNWLKPEEVELYVEPKKTKSEGKVEFNSVIISDDKRNQIKQAISQIGNSDLIFNKWGFGEVFEKGTAVSLLFYGVPGTGKTLMAQAIADKMEQKLLTIGPAEIETSTPGGAERNIKRYFKIAAGELGAEGEPDKEGNPQMLAPCKHILLFDECDSLITNRDNVGIIMRGQINTLLSELERFEGIVVFTTNSIKSLDPAMERRLTSKVEFEFPDKEARKKIWKRMLPEKAPLGKDIDLDKLAEFQFAGGNIKNIVLNAARTAAYKKAPTITFSCFLDAMEHEAVGLKAFEATFLAANGRQKQLKRGETGIEIVKEENETTK